MTTTGTVREWHDEHGWGVVVSDDAPGGVYAHHSQLVDQDGFTSLVVGETVHFEPEPTAKEGFESSAVNIRRTDQRPSTGIE